MRITQIVANFSSSTWFDGEYNKFESHWANIDMNDLEVGWLLFVLFDQKLFKTDYELPTLTITITTKQKRLIIFNVGWKKNR